MENILNQLIVHLTVLMSIAGSVTVAIEQTKPVWKDFVLNFGKEAFGEDNSQKVYLSIIYILRTLVGIFTIYQLGGVSSFETYAPFLNNFADSGVLFVSVLLVALGSEFIVPVLDLLRKLAAKPTIVSSVTTATSTTVSASSVSANPAVTEVVVSSSVPSVDVSTTEDRG